MHLILLYKQKIWCLIPYISFMIWKHMIIMYKYVYKIKRYHWKLEIIMPREPSLSLRKDSKINGKFLPGVIPICVNCNRLNINKAHLNYLYWFAIIEDTVISVSYSLNLSIRYFMCIFSRIIEIISHIHNFHMNSMQFIDR